MQSQEEENFYDILGVSKQATDDQIKSAYKRLAMKWHPDRNKGSEEATKTFQKISGAYEILSDPKKKEIYDKYGSRGLREQPNMFDPNMFGMFFGGQQTQQLEPTVVQCEITFSDIFANKQMQISYIYSLRCKTCNACGYTDGNNHLCKRCSGEGKIKSVIQNGPFIQQSVVVCNECHGKGKDKYVDPSISCEDCKGVGTLNKNTIYEFNIPQTCFQRPQIVVPGMGSYDIKSMKYKHLVINLNIIQEKDYHISTDHKLLYTLKISFGESLCGFKKVIKHPNGKNIAIISEAGIVISPNKMFTIENLGFFGKWMYLNFEIAYPEKITFDSSKSLTPENVLHAIDGHINDETNKSYTEEIHIANLIPVSVKENETSQDERPQCAQQ